MKILITGGCGFIGSHLVQNYHKRADVIVLDNLTTGFQENLSGLNCQFVKGSILDQGLLARLMNGVDIVYHLAALVSVPDSMGRPLETVEVNVRGLLNVMESAKQHQVKKFVFASSAAVYGDSHEDPKMEYMTPAPRSPYAITKLDGEYYCRIFREEKWLSTACLRFFNVFGPRQSQISAYAAAIPIFFDRALKNKPITIFGDGMQTRDFVYVKDVISAMSIVGEEKDIEGVFNVGCGKSVSIRSVATQIKEITKSTSSLKFMNSRAGDLKFSTASTKKLLDIGWKPQYSFSEGLEELMSHIEMEN